MPHNEDHPDTRNKLGQFTDGNKGNGGRRKGAKNRLNADFVVALQQDFQEHGEATIRIVRAENPRDYLKIIASILPKEFILEDGRLESMTDDELDGYLNEIRRLKSAGPGQTLELVGVREEATANGEQPRLLSSVSETEGLP
jgi:hypothetical protein